MLLGTWCNTETKLGLGIWKLEIFGRFGEEQKEF